MSLHAFPAFASKEVGPIDVTVALPPGYDGAAQRYAVLYMQDGQNLFDGDGKPPFFPASVKWGADTTAANLMADGTIRPVIVVGIAHLGVRRMRQYMPQAVFDRLPAATKAAFVADNGGAPFSDAYLRFLVHELKPFIDRTYRTRSGRADTFIMGSSMGGLISLYALSEHPEVFGGAACLSTHWPVFLAPEQQASSFEPVIAAFESYLQEKLPPPGDRRLWLDHGTGTLDAAYGPYEARIDSLLRARGWREGVRFVSRIYPGAIHNEVSWRARLADPLTFLLSPAAQ